MLTANGVSATKYPSTSMTARIGPLIDTILPMALTTLNPIPQTSVGNSSGV